MEMMRKIEANRFQLVKLIEIKNKTYDEGLRGLVIVPRDADLYRYPSINSILSGDIALHMSCINLRG